MRDIRYTSSPLLASKTPVWRSKFIVAMLALAFIVLFARAAYVQVIGNAFFQRQGEVRFARTLEMPASRGRIFDRNGLLLASSVVAPSIWAIPDDVERNPAKLQQLAKLLGMPMAELNKKLADEDKTFVWLKRQVDEPVAKQIAELKIAGIHQRKEYKRKYPEGEAAAHVVGFANVENRGQEGAELSFEKQLSGKVTPQTQIATAPGTYKLDKFTIRDTHNYGTLTVEGVVQKSSNVGSLKIAQRLSAQEMWDTYTALGYGHKPDLAFPGAATGRVRHWKGWRPVEQATMSYGYGLSASLFQMAHSYTAFSHDGRVIRATLVKAPDDTAVEGVRVFSEKNARAVRKMLEMAAGPGGTGQRAQTVGYSVGGKSGTARKQQGKGYASNKYRAWFTGMAPIDKPRVIVAVMVDEPSNGVYYGGAVAAPVFSEVVQQTLRIMGVQPDMAVKPAIVAEQVEESF